MDKKRPSSNNNKELQRYAGLAVQLLAAIGIAVFVGLKADEWLHVSPLFACILPLLVLGASFYRLAKDTGHKQKDEHDAT